MTFNMMKKKPVKKNSKNNIVLPNNILSDLTSSALVSAPDAKKTILTSP